jgi:hypothetical protein
VTSARPIPEFFTAAEVADVLKVTPDFVIRKFENRKGVIDLGSGETRFKRRYRVLRIPRKTLNDYLAEVRAA